MIVKDLIKLLETLPQEKSITCQVVGQESGVWMMGFEFTDIKDSWMVNLKVDHPRLKKLPMDWD